MRIDKLLICFNKNVEKFTKRRYNFCVFIIYTGFRLVLLADNGTFIAFTLGAMQNICIAFFEIRVCSELVCKQSGDFHDLCRKLKKGI